MVAPLKYLLTPCLELLAAHLLIQYYMNKYLYNFSQHDLIITEVYDDFNISKCNFCDFNVSSIQGGTMISLSADHLVF